MMVKVMAVFVWSPFPLLVAALWRL